MCLALRLFRPALAQRRIFFSRSLSLPSRNRTWNLPSPSSSLNDSDSSRCSKPQGEPLLPQSKKISQNTRRGKASQISVTRLATDAQHTGFHPRNHAGGDMQSTSAKPTNHMKTKGKSDESWVARKAALRARYPEGWKPVRKISPEAMEGIRILHRQVHSHLWQN
jgi:hypothetical protein